MPGSSGSKKRPAPLQGDAVGRFDNLHSDELTPLKKNRKSSGFAGSASSSLKEKPLSLSQASSSESSPFQSSQSASLARDTPASSSSQQAQEIPMKEQFLVEMPDALAKCIDGAKLKLSRSGAWEVIGKKGKAGAMILGAPTLLAHTSARGLFTLDSPMLRLTGGTLIPKATQDEEARTHVEAPVCFGLMLTQ
eukprot:NODE_6867_length_811_cov_189.380814_g6631_i0.p1 GENE.NODE_6867_length_811_cov_189.380814_g6631_i0~~NODE_6867_length_811_cov_189.380814_g6631_i0.p1  ORF type:complete len:193 (-),score=3.79 NODE_6867_length_811_cov_189.380814_g6631_i0:174-752(-)